MKSEDISKIADGDEMVFTRFMEHYSTRLYYYAYGLLGQKEMAEEVVSETITYRKSISYLRKETGKNELSFDEISDFSFEPVQSPDEEIISKEEVAEINNAIEKLPPKCKHVFFLAKIEGLPYIKIAEMLEVSVQTVNYHIAYAIEALSKSLKIASPKKK